MSNKETKTNRQDLRTRQLPNDEQTISVLHCNCCGVKLVSSIVRADCSCLVVNYCSTTCKKQDQLLHYPVCTARQRLKEARAALKEARQHSDIAEEELYLRFWLPFIRERARLLLQFVIKGNYDQTNMGMNVFLLDITFTLRLKHEENGSNLEKDGDDDDVQKEKKSSDTDNTETHSISFSAFNVRWLLASIHFLKSTSSTPMRMCQYHHNHVMEHTQMLHFSPPWILLASTDSSFLNKVGLTHIYENSSLAISFFIDDNQCTLMEPYLDPSAEEWVIYLIGYDDATNIKIIWVPIGTDVDDQKHRMDMNFYIMDYNDFIGLLFHKIASEGNILTSINDVVIFEPLINLTAQEQHNVEKVFLQKLEKARCSDEFKNEMYQIDGKKWRVQLYDSVSEKYKLVTFDCPVSETEEVQFLRKAQLDVLSEFKIDAADAATAAFEPFEMDSLESCLVVLEEWCTNSCLGLFPAMAKANIGRQQVTLNPLVDATVVIEPPLTRSQIEQQIHASAITMYQHMASVLTPVPPPNLQITNMSPSTITWDQVIELEHELHCGDALDDGKERMEED